MLERSRVRDSKKRKRHCQESCSFDREAVEDAQTLCVSGISGVDKSITCEKNAVESRIDGNTSRRASSFRMVRAVCGIHRCSILDLDGGQGGMTTIDRTDCLATHDSKFVYRSCYVWWQSSRCEHCPLTRGVVCGIMLEERIGPAVHNASLSGCFPDGATNDHS